jgi:hypothetical protein
MATTRSRPLPVKNGRGLLRVVDVDRRPQIGTKVTETRDDLAGAFPKGTQVTVSENHPQWRSRRGRAFGDIGGGFYTEKTKVSFSSKVNLVSTVQNPPYGYLEETYRGPCVAVTGGSFPSPIKSNELALNGWGAKAVANAKPTNALVDLSTTLGELLGTGGIPSMIGRAAFWAHGIKEALKETAGDFLNVQFSLTPIVQDMVGFADVVYRFDQLVKQYERDAGKVVRRKYFFEPITTESNSVWATNRYPVMAPSSGNMQEKYYGLGTGYLSRKTEIRRWFSGAFTYHLPTGYSSRRAVTSFGAEAQKMLGLEPTPETLWNLAPWSWAVDWFSSAGDVVSNISDWSSDGLVMRYGYLMEHCVSTDTYYLRCPRGTPSPVVYTRESKSRTRANPFGFGLTWAGLSPRQLAIAAALGISQGLK